MKSIPLALYMNGKAASFVVQWPTLPMINGMLNETEFESMILETVGMFGKGEEIPETFWNIFLDVEMDLFILQLHYVPQEIIQSTFLLIPYSQRTAYLDSETDQTLQLIGIGSEYVLLELVEHKSGHIMVPYASLGERYIEVKQGYSICA